MTAKSGQLLERVPDWFLKSPASEDSLHLKTTYTEGQRNLGDLRVDAGKVHVTSYRIIWYIWSAAGRAIPDSRTRALPIKCEMSAAVCKLYGVCYTVMLTQAKVLTPTCSIIYRCTAYTGV